jgi:SAM-dependent methyltransferase
VTSQRASDLSPAVVEEARAWNSIADGWHAWIPRMREWYSPATELMLDLAYLAEGDRVLDIAAGDCDQSIAAGGRVGPDGRVLAIDVAEDLLEIGARSAREAGMRNVETRAMDAGDLDLPDESFDAVICRFALMYLPDPVNALHGMKRVLRQGGRVSVVVYGVNGSPEFPVALAAVRQRLGLPRARSRAHGLGEPVVLERTMTAGGFRGIEIHALTLPIRMASADECVHYLQATSPTVKELTSPLPEDERRRVWDEVRAALSVFVSDGGFQVEHKVLVAAGGKAT